MTSNQNVKIHFAVEWDTKYAHHTGTLCGRESSKTEEINCEVDAVKVTCKLCANILNDKSHWRYRKFVAKSR